MLSFVWWLEEPRIHDPDTISAIMMASKMLLSGKRFQAPHKSVLYSILHITSWKNSWQCNILVYFAIVHVNLHN